MIPADQPPHALQEVAHREHPGLALVVHQLQVGLLQRALDRRQVRTAIQTRDILPRPGQTHGLYSADGAGPDDGDLHARRAAAWQRDMDSRHVPSSVGVPW